jgi:hypothetical protein
MSMQSNEIPGAGLVIPGTAASQDRYHSTLQSCRKLNGINVLLKRSILDNWVENYRLCPAYLATICRKEQHVEGLLL